MGRTLDNVSNSFCCGIYLAYRSGEGRSVPPSWRNDNPAQWILPLWDPDFISTDIDTASLQALLNLGLKDNFKKSSAKLGFEDFEELVECERDAALGNGGAFPVFFTIYPTPTRRWLVEEIFPLSHYTLFSELLCLGTCELTLLLFLSHRDLIRPADSIRRDPLYPFSRSRTSCGLLHRLVCYLRTSPMVRPYYLSTDHVADVHLQGLWSPLPLRHVLATDLYGWLSD